MVVSAGILDEEDETSWETHVVSCLIAYILVSHEQENFLRRRCIGYTRKLHNFGKAWYMVVLYKIVQRQECLGGLTEGQVTIASGHYFHPPLSLFWPGENPACSVPVL